VKLDLDRMDNNDNRLFGVAAKIARVRELSCQLTIRPLYAGQTRTRKRELTRRANHRLISIVARVAKACAGNRPAGNWPP
jgi:hypothetical protein